MANNTEIIDNALYQLEIEGLPKPIKLKQPKSFSGIPCVVCKHETNKGARTLVVLKDADIMVQTDWTHITSFATEEKTVCANCVRNYPNLERFLI